MPPIVINRAPFNALVDDSGNNMDGTPWNKAAIKSVLLDPIDVALADADDGTTKDAAQDTLITAHTNQLALINTAWTVYTPTWATDTGAAPAIGNGFIVGRYTVIGKTCHVFINLKLGPTTTLGGGSLWSFGLPNTPFQSPHNHLALFVNQAGSAFPPGVCVSYSTNTVYAVTSTGGGVGPTIPFAWVANCQLFIRATYELA